MISHPLPKFKTQFSQKKKVGSYDNIALNQRYLDSELPHHRLLSQIARIVVVLSPLVKS